MKIGIKCFFNKTTAKEIQLKEFFKAYLPTNIHNIFV